jgi:hypothetical protein
MRGLRIRREGLTKSAGNRTAAEYTGQLEEKRFSFLERMWQGCTLRV